MAHKFGMVGAEILHNMDNAPRDKFLGRSLKWRQWWDIVVYALWSEVPTQIFDTVEVAAPGGTILSS